MNPKEISRRRLLAIPVAIAAGLAPPCRREPVRGRSEVSLAKEDSPESGVYTLSLIGNLDGEPYADSVERAGLQMAVRVKALDKSVKVECLVSRLGERQPRGGRSAVLPNNTLSEAHTLLIAWDNWTIILVGWDNMFLYEPGRINAPPGDKNFAPFPR